jgi:hypothetical protein
MVRNKINTNRRPRVVRPVETRTEVGWNPRVVGGLGRAPPFATPLANTAEDASLINRVSGEGIVLPPTLGEVV